MGKQIEFQKDLLVFDKKRMKLKEAGFPQLVVDQTPKALRGAKVPVVKAKIFSNLGIDHRLVVFRRPNRPRRRCITLKGA